MRRELFRAMSWVLLLGCGGSSPDGGDGGADADAGAVLAIQGAAMRTGRAGDALADACVVVLTRGGAPVDGAVITFEVVAGGGAVDTPSSLTSPDGSAATGWKLGFSGAGQRLRASAEGAEPVEFAADATARAIAFDAPITSPAGVLPWGLGVGEFDSTPGRDLVVGLRGPQRLVVLSNQGNSGQFSAPVLAPTLDADPRGLVIANLDGDAYDDVVVAVEDSPSGVIGTFTGSATGALVAKEVLAGAGDQPWDVALADLDGDGARDILASAHASGELAVFKATSPSTFGPAPSLFSTGGPPDNSDPRGLAVGSLGNAGVESSDLADVVVALNQRRYQTTANQSFGVLLGEPGIAFSQVALHEAGVQPIDVALGDLDGDGRLDVVTSNQSTPGTLAISRGLGNGAFAAPTSVTLAARPEQLVIADLEGDGRPEIVVTLPTLKQVHVFTNDGAGQFSAGARVALALGAEGNEQALNVIVADVDADGLPDIVTANEGTNNVSVLLRQ